MNQDLNQLSMSPPPIARQALLSSRPRADQFCVYFASNEQGSETRIAAFVVEYKAPHKLPLNFIYDGLHDMELEDVLQEREYEDDNLVKRRLIAAATTQAFSYMVCVGAQYGCVSSGEATILAVEHTLYNDAQQLSITPFLDVLRLFSCRALQYSVFQPDSSSRPLQRSPCLPQRYPFPIPVLIPLLADACVRDTSP
ncbi:MAG: hypothetical protein M1829_004004 [Trizodia sp. TS-e1964]|nr:MAG: hypothetical protein M1829_004004 [Trizodia sp. TS-e1964]